MDAKVEIQRAKDAARRKEYAAARSILRNVLAAEPANVDAWVAFASVAQKREHAEQCLIQAAKLDPANEKIQEMLARLRQTSPSAASTRMEVVQNEPYQAVQPGIGHASDLVSGSETSPANAQTTVPDDSLSAFLQPLQPIEAVPATPATPASQAAPLPGSSGSAVRGKRTAASRGCALETILLVILVGIACFVVAGLGAIYLPRLPLVANLIQARPTPNLNEITAPIYANIDASNAEDINAYMATIHSLSPGYDQTQSMLGPLFADYDLSYQLTHVEVIEQKRNEAKVAFILVTRKLRGPAFNDNQVTGVMIMRPENGVWKIYNQEIDSVDYIK